jgi:cyclic pyranopterin phosphate synthase
MRFLHIAVVIDVGASTLAGMLAVAVDIAVLGQQVGSQDHASLQLPQGRRDPLGPLRQADGPGCSTGPARPRTGCAHRIRHRLRAARQPVSSPDPPPADGPHLLRDGHGRLIGDVRISLTDRCNFRCQYCMPAEGLPWIEQGGLLAFDEIVRLVSLLAAMGVGDVRLTGGEPLVRRDLPRLITMLSEVPGVDDLSLTTNGYLLERQAEALVAAGVRRFNISVDSLQRDRFYRLTRRDALPQVLRGIEALGRAPQAPPIKINAVAIRDFTEQEVLPFAAFAREHPYEVRFIEYMPLDADRAWTPEQVLSGREIRDLIHATYPLEPEPRTPSATARVYRFADGRGRIGFINPVSEPFCSDCNRIRITADGRLRTCLFSLHETDLLTPMRAGVTDGDLVRIIRDAVWRKELKHHVGEAGFVQPARSMSAIGG